ncbi:phosphatidylinositol-glycan biosynthesis class X protein isoform X1 [Bombyx mandarina]|uniref:Phosphatidylinositol-glycan biosynthesis class X protein n=2 Tax=Bombyx TaxID=7090 RepID=A0A8R2C5M4_BOMMO|nr:phosphatidylinositol-glycan biosynthesis class X protein isoform X1 [Bombyx mori]XP_028032741.1 phosphatidylinositol-glycan biosynthesis class X protein isoform X1 [Bombyx mandarina]
MLTNIFSFRICIVVFVAIKVFSASKCDYDVKIAQILINDGYHRHHYRNLTYHIIFNEDSESKGIYNGCRIGLDQYLPAGVFVNPNELNEFNRLERLNAFPRGRVNIELPTEEAEPINVFIISELTDDEIQMWLPVHARYHESVSGGGMVQYDIGPPKMYLYCADRRLDVCDRSVSPSVTLTCNGGVKMCSWRDIPYTVLTDPLVWRVPVGNSNHFYIIGIGTAFAIMVGTTMVIRAMHDHILKHRRLIIR